MNSRLTRIILPVAACIIYVCFDFLYIFLAKDRYAKIVQDIQKEKMEIDTVAALICYIIMAVGWYFITVQLAKAYFDRLKQRSASWPSISSSALSGLVAGFLYGFVVYGVYNCTTRAIFCFVVYGVYNCTTRAIFASRYPISLLVQDLAWGSLYNMVFTCVYMLIWHKLCSPIDL
ncbi:unnamed protein product [Rotaria magnacalcarata]|uniref:Uncharacterized protein n=1 Tax=Rotaria magnacalcarata TaxID=392030 RepID=A0A816WKH3_9BILA|nr:unnamed protein product [Rotaria magnacalcarata]